MSTPVGSSQWMYSTPSGFYPYLIDQSLRFNDADNANLKFDITTDGDRKTFTLSFWFKIGNLGSGSAVASNDHRYFYTDGNSSNFSYISLSGDDRFYMQLNDGSGRVVKTDRLLRDASAWYHAVVAVDTTQSTNTDRVKIYINGEQQTFSSAAYPTQNNDTTINKNGNDHLIGKYGGSNDRNFDGYMAEMHFVSGSQLDPTSFGETINGVWVPKAYSGSYGTNGFYLSFADSSAMGDDLSGNGNDFTANNLAASDVVPDSPTNSFCTMNVLDDNFSTPKFSYFEGNLKYTYSYTGSGFDRVFGTHMIEPGDTNKYYMEFTGNVTNEQMQWGVVATDSSTYSPSDRTTGITAASDINLLRWASYRPAPYLRRVDGDGDNALTTTNGNAANGDIFSIVYDAGAGKFFAWFNGVEFSGQDYSAGTSLWTTLDTTKTYAVMMYQGDGGGSTKNGNMTANFGQDSSFAGAKTAQGNTDANGIGDFYYAVPTDAVALCSANLPEPTISPNAEEQADDYFNTVLYTGNGTDNTAITGVGFQPDWVWVKTRSAASTHILSDSVRGATKQLFSNLTNAEQTDTTKIKSFDADGFTLGTDGAGTGSSNTNTVTYVAWNWKAGGTAVSNTDGSITSQVSAAPDAGFSIVSWTGNATNPSTIGHGLSSAPEMIILKNRDSAGDWYIGHDDIGWTDRLKFTTAATASSSTLWNNTAPTSSVFTISSALNFNGDATIAYCFHSSDICKVGSYVGNGSADGTFVYTGFRPAWVMLKRTDAADNWGMHDSARGAYNVNDWRLYANASNAEASGGSFGPDFLSNGFKLRTTNSGWNASGGSYIYLAFAEAPAKYSNAR